MNLTETVTWMLNNGIVSGSVADVLGDALAAQDILTANRTGIALDQVVKARVGYPVPPGIDRKRDDVRRVIEKLRLGETFDEYRQTRVADGAHTLSVAWIAESIADAFVEAADWDEADRLEKATQA